MLASVVPWVVAAFAASATVFLFLKLRAERANSQELESEAAALEENLRTAGKRSESRSAGERRRGDELAELRRKLEKAKKRATQAREEQLAESHRIKDLEDRLRLRDADVRAARSDGQRQPEGLAPKPPAPAPALEKPVPPPVAPPPKAPEVVESEALVAASKRVERAEAERRAAQVKLAELETQVKRLQGKVKTQDKLYASMRLELEAKKDRLSTQQEELERLRALKVAWMDSPAEDDPSLAVEETTVEAAPPVLTE